MIQRILKDREIPEVLKELGEDIDVLQKKYDIPLIISASDKGDYAVTSFNGCSLDLAPLLLNTVKNFKDNASEIAWKSFVRCLVDIVLEED
jgi:hypothetical protein